MAEISDGAGATAATALDRTAEEALDGEDVDLEADLGSLLPDDLLEEPREEGPDLSAGDLDGLFSDMEDEPADAQQPQQELRGETSPGSDGLDGLFSDLSQPMDAQKPQKKAAQPEEVVPGREEEPSPQPAPAGPHGAASAAAAREEDDEPEPPLPPPPDPPPPPSVPSSFDTAAPAAARNLSAGDEEFADESRFMLGPNDEKLLKWKVDYAPRGGNGRAMCRDLDCLERHDQAGVRTIEKGALRIGRRVLMEKPSPNLVIFWHHARCMFNTFLRSRNKTRVIQSEQDLEGFSALTPEDQDLLRRFIDGSLDVRKAKGAATGGAAQGGSGAGSAGPPLDTPEKRAASRDPDGAPAFKKGVHTWRDVHGRKGERVWTFCRVRAPEGPGGAVLGGGWAKSTKPELGLVIAEEGGSVIIQFESEEHEKERVEAFNNPKYRNRKAWLRYPRVFEGKKQRIPQDWIRWKRPPPLLCSCTKQQWGHHCDCGISCGRGGSSKVWGVCQ